MQYPVIVHGCHRGADRLGQHLAAVDAKALGVHIGADKTIGTIGDGG